MTLRLTLIANAATAVTRRAAFSTDEVLEPQVLAKAATMAGSLGRVDAAWTGPSLRTRQTAAALGLIASVDLALADIDLAAGLAVPWPRSLRRMWRVLRAGRLIRQRRLMPANPSLNSCDGCHPLVGPNTSRSGLCRGRDPCRRHPRRHYNSTRCEPAPVLADRYRIPVFCTAPGVHGALDIAVSWAEGLRRASLKFRVC
jgi:hypothetical protein